MSHSACESDPTRRPQQRSTLMYRVLLPVDDSRASRYAVRHVILECKRNEAMDIHVLNVQLPLRQHIAQFVSTPNRESFYRDEAERALRPVRLLLDDAGTPYTVHTKVGHRAEVITEMASQLGCDHIVMGTARKSSITRTIESSVMNKVIELTRVPVVVIAGDKASMAERYGAPAAIGMGLALLLFAAVD